jgi:three-Cys-motif partner protein
MDELGMNFPVLGYKRSVMAKVCACGEPKKPNGNCPTFQDQTLPYQCVGAWVVEKHDYLRRYVEATSGPRSKFVKPTPERPRPGGAAFIDLFAGPGRARTREGDVIDGSPLIALRHETSPFTRVIMCELDAENVAALGARTVEFGERAKIVQGDCNKQISEIVALTPENGLNLAFYDPFAPATFRWDTLSALGQRTRMDLIIHFPTNGVRRNFDSVDIDGMIGCTDWRSTVHHAGDVVKLIGYLQRSLASIGYTDERVRVLQVKNDQQGLLYHLVFATKNPLGNRIWKSITRTDPSGQRSMFD